MMPPRSLRTVLEFALLAAVVSCLAGPASAQRADGRHSTTAVKHLEEDPDYLAKLPKVIWRRPMGPYVSDVWSGYYGGPGPAKLIVKQAEHSLKIMGANFLLVWDDCRGGEISEIFLFDGGTWNHVNCTMAYQGRDTIPRYRIQRQKDFFGESPVYYLNQAAGTEFHITRQDPDRVDFWTENRMVTTDRDAGPWIVRQDFRVYATGVVVCDFEIKLDEKAGSFGLRHAQMGAYLEDVLFTEIYVKYPVHFRWGSGTFGGATTSEANWKAYSEDGMLAMGSASFGVSQFADFNNRFEFWLERPTPFVGKDVKSTRTNFQVFSSDLWFEPSDMSTRPNCGRAYEWELYKNDPVTITVPFSYRNRWVLAVGGAKVGGAGSGAARRSNLLAARAANWANTEAAGKASWYPDGATLAKLSKLGADTLVFARGWAKPDDPIEAVDAAKFAAAVKKAHDLRMRVVLSVPLQAAAKAGKLFEGRLTANRDGLLVEGLGTTTMKPDAAGGYDLAGRIETLASLRRAVGEGGILIGRAETGLPSQIELAFLDAAVPADEPGRPPNSVDQLLTSDASVGCVLSPLVSGGRITLVNLAAVPGAPQLVLGANTPTDPDAPENQSLAPLWWLLSRLDGPVLHALSPRLENNLSLRVEPPATPTLAYLTETQMLLVIANPSERGGRKVTVGPELGVKNDAAGKLLTLEGGTWKETPVKLSGGVIDILEMNRDEVRAYEFPRSAAPKPGG